MNATTVRQHIKDYYQRLRQLEHQRNNPDMVATINIDVYGEHGMGSATLFTPTNPLSEAKPGSFALFEKVTADPTNPEMEEVGVWEDLDDFIDELLQYPLGTMSIIIPTKLNDETHCYQQLQWPGQA